MTRRIDAHSLRLFVTAAREGSIARGAAKEHIAASALSRRIADLEQALDAALVVRSPRGIELTAAGRVVYERAVKIDQDIEALKREAQAHEEDVSGTVRLAANPSSIVGYLPERLKQYTSTYPKVRIALSESDTADILRACSDDRADVGIAVKTELDHNLESWFFASDPLLVVLPLSHPLQELSQLHFEHVMRYPIIGIRRGGALDALLHIQGYNEGSSLDTAVQVGSFDAACRMVEVGLGVAVMPQSAARAYAGTERFVRRPLDEAWAARELYVYAMKKTPRLRAVQHLIDTLLGDS